MSTTMRAKTLVACALLSAAVAVAAKEYAAELVRVVDGDTIDAEITIDVDDTLFDMSFVVNERVRLAGIDAPEIRTRDLEEKAKGQASTKHLAMLLGEAAFVLEVDESNPRGKFGRVIGTVYKGELNINQQMVADGHAEPH